jgi:GNAT superfamily N-acetyltransferase
MPLTAPSKSTVPSGIAIRPAKLSDLDALVALFADDSLGGHGDTTDPAALAQYRAAFERIVASPNDDLYVAETSTAVIGTIQTTLITSLTARGASNLLIEAVQVRADMRGRGVGAQMIRFAVQKGREAGARLIQLTSNAARTDAHRFYERLGFDRSHVGFKKKLRD